MINQSSRFWGLAHAGCQQAAREQNVRIELHVPGNSSAAQQQQIVETLITKGCAGLAISLFTPDSMTRLLNEAARYMPGKMFESIKSS